MRYPYLMDFQDKIHYQPLQIRIWLVVMEKQETRLRESLKEQDAKISEMVSGKKDPSSPPPQSKT